jgi:peptidoglycan/xylan/chitin deacetylase (PgdA/CDA1 family)
MSYQWPNGARLALSVVVNVEEGAEGNILDGDKGPEPVDELQAVPHKPIRAHGNETNYQYGIIEAAPRILKLLDRVGARATWTSAAVALERAPALAAAIMARGDEVCAHGYRWVHQFYMDEEKERAFITQARDTIARVTGKRPMGWLSRYLHTDNTRRILAEEGFTYHVDDYSRDEPFWDLVTKSDGSTTPMVITPYAVDTNDMKFWLTPGYSVADWLSYAKATLDWLYEEGAERPRMMSLGLHLRIIGRAGRIGALQQFLDYAAAKPGVWFASRGEIAAHFAANVAPPVPALKPDGEPR